MEFIQENVQNNIVVRLSGRLDAAAVRSHRDEITAIIDSASNNSFILNLAKIDFIDSSGLGFVVSLLKQANGKKSHFSLCEMTPQTKTLFELTRMSQIFTIYDTEDIALEVNDH